MNKPKKSAGKKVRKLEDYIKLARLPDEPGIVGRVVDVLSTSIGQGSSTVDAVADGLGLSKRTLQRRLKEKNTNFSELLDQVRFHHAINYLVEEPFGIEVVAELLDYTDRTSFTAAFNRLTGMPPMSFRKLFSEKQTASTDDA